VINLKKWHNEIIWAAKMGDIQRVKEICECNRVMEVNLISNPTQLSFDELTTLKNIKNILNLNWSTNFEEILKILNKNALHKSKSISNLSQEQIKKLMRKSSIRSLSFASEREK